MRGLFRLFLLFICAANVSVLAKEPSRFEVETMTVWHEARGEPIFVQQLVLDVLRNRATMSGKSLLEVVSESGQFPWRQRVKSWKLTPEQAEFGFTLLAESTPVRSRFMYFNHVPHTFTKRNVRVGGMYFAVK